MAVTQSALVDDYLAKGTNQTDIIDKDRGAVAGNKLRIMTADLEIADGAFDADGDVVVLCPLHIDDVVHSLTFGFDEHDAGTDSLVNIGLYVDAAGTDVEDEDAYASAVTTFRAASATFGTNLAFEARGVEKAGQSVWEDAGYATRAAALAATEAFRGRLFLALTQTATVSDDSGGGTLAFQVVYSSDH